MLRAELECEDGVAEVVPVDDEFCVSKETQHLSNDQNGDGGWRLEFVSVNGEYFGVI